jgi:iturin family lipopeptide synthetase C
MSFDRHSGWPDDSTGLRRRMFPYTGARKTASKCDLTLFCTEGDNSLTLAFEYCSGIFTKQRMERMGRHLTEVVKSIAAGPQMKIAALEWISEAEKRQLLDDFNDTARQYRPDDHFCRLFAGTVGANPDSSALVFHGQTMSYAELDQYSNRLAKLIVNHGTGPGDVVGIVMNRSMGMIAAIIAVLKTGAAYLPVDPIYPDDRIGYMLENSGARLVITNTAPERRTRFSQTVIDIRGPVLSGPADIPPPRSRPDDLMYVIYTSGTTGTPKGIAVEQQNFLNYLNYMKEVFNFSAARTILCATSVSFDIFSFETLIPLTSGMRVVILDEPEQKDPARILDVILKEAVNMVQLTPSHLGMLTQVDPELKCFQNVDTLLLAGESIPPGLFRRVRQYYPHKFCNGYGPTEATVYTSIKDLSGESRVTIGKPVANSRVYIWDENQKLLPVGVPGELVISGRCVARGYINNHALNQRYFVQDPFDPAQKCYKSGDIALWLENGDLAVLGRQDRQVKIRGNRVEPAEIEAVLLEAGGVKDVTVVDRRDHQEQVHLCAYLVPAAGYDLAALKRSLKAKLPDYMIPAYFITLDQIPLNVNGKVDRGQLPPPGRINIGLDREFIPPAELLEYEIAVVWRRVLAIDRAGVEDNFFELGGSSFNIIRVNSELNQLLDREIELLELFRYPTIRSLARHLKNEPEISGDSPDGEESGGGLSGGRDKLRRRRHRIKERSDVNE